MALDVVENALLSHESQHPLPKTANPRVQIAGNFTPVPKQPVKHRLPVIGTIPDCIQGVMFETELTHFMNQSPVAISSTVTTVTFYTYGLFGLVDPSHGTGVANAGLVSAAS
ncbi:hypothetical protein J1N35_043158 [Gossypium stocksii]|uniref:Uncharacterized protein n=1 Tax=Gossypium stocksii TaxID=47602 RepID=A0A9D3U6Y6_9ROSI|nr:hypothetical protein J1N35_043158 [Gossypium stocksii]